MTKIIFTVVISLFVTACGVGDSMRESAKKNPKTHARMLAADNGCLSCHAVSVTVVGPAWKLVAKKYKNAPDAKSFLIDKIKKGGKGNWDHMTGGQSMPPHEDKMTDDDIAKVVDYILTL